MSTYILLLLHGYTLFIALLYIVYFIAIHNYNSVVTLLIYVLHYYILLLHFYYSAIALLLH